jgi:hypothetical protein
MVSTATTGIVTTEEDGMTTEAMVSTATTGIVVLQHIINSDCTNLRMSGKTIVFSNYNFIDSIVFYM